MPPPESHFTGGRPGGGGRRVHRGRVSRVPSGPHLLIINTSPSKMLLEHLRSSRRGKGSALGRAAELRARGAPWGRGSAPLGSQQSPPAPHPAPRPAPTSAPFQAEFVSIIELPATYLKSLTRPLEERCIARSKSFELFLSPQIREQQATFVCLNLVCAVILCRAFFSVETGA